MSNPIAAVERLFIQAVAGGLKAGAGQLSPAPQQALIQDLALLRCALGYLSQECDRKDGTIADLRGQIGSLELQTAGAAPLREALIDMHEQCKRRGVYETRLLSCHDEIESLLAHNRTGHELLAYVRAMKKSHA